MTAHNPTRRKGRDMQDDIRKLKWIADGASTLSDAAARLRAEADELERLEREGWQLAEPVNDSYLHLEFTTAPVPS
jgi:hypothetical protein